MHEPAAACESRPLLPRNIDPTDLLRLWPRGTPLACAVSALGSSAWSRWSIFAAPSATLRCVRTGESGTGFRTEWIGEAGSHAPSIPFEVLHDPLVDLERALAFAPGRIPTRGDHAGGGALGAPPFMRGWIGWLSYDLWRVIEARAAAKRAPGAVDDRSWPLWELMRCDGALVHDRLTGEWSAVGDVRALPVLEESGGGAMMSGPAAVGFGGVRSGMVREAYMRAVERGTELIRAGDVFQVNLAHRLSAAFTGSSRGIAGLLMESASPWYGAYIESRAAGVGAGMGVGACAGAHPSRAICSISPELFLSFDARTRRVRTRPIKGTLTGNRPESDLLASAKDKAELVMIVDLMRNDLGRVCEFGSVRVERMREIERHAGTGAGGVLHGVATVDGRVRAGASAVDILRAAFPPGSVTGAPKVRAMQIIDELEPVRRGPYCGAIGFFDDDAGFGLNVAIRTALVTLDSGDFHDGAGTLDYSVGAGIVAESDPESEWCETLAKAAPFTALVHAHAAGGADPAEGLCSTGAPIAGAAR